jgi:DNA-binding transcriptional ArsR family regulator
MVEYALDLDSVFSSLADPTRRDILRRLSDEELSVGQIAQPYDLTFAAISKHLKIMERAQLIIKRRLGKQQLVQLSPIAFQSASDYLNFYQNHLVQRFDSLEHYLEKENEYV